MQYPLLVSVIVPCYNQAQFLPEALNSVLSQTYENWECIVVNDGSPDNTEEIALEWCKKDSRFKYLNKENGGIATARNEGINSSRGIYILPLDADDKIGPKYVEKATHILNTKNEVGIVYCEAEYFGDKSGKWNLPEYSEDGMLTMNKIFCTALFRKSDYLETKGYNPNMVYGWEDWDFWLSLIENGKGVIKLPDVHFFYRYKSFDSMVNDLGSNLEKQKLSLNTIYMNHFDFYIKKHGHPMELYSQLNCIKYSKEYRFGKHVLKPFRFIKKIFQ